MKRTEPATLDMHGAMWGPHADTFTMDPTALRYEQYEICFAAKVGLGHTELDSIRSSSVGPVLSFSILERCTCPSHNSIWDCWDCAA